MKRRACRIETRTQSVKHEASIQKHLMRLQFAPLRIFGIPADSIANEIKVPLNKSSIAILYLVSVVEESKSELASDEDVSHLIECCNVMASADSHNQGEGRIAKHINLSFSLTCEPQLARPHHPLRLRRLQLLPFAFLLLMMLQQTNRHCQSIPQRPPVAMLGA